MKDFFKSKIVTTIVVLATIILAGVAIFTALRLYQLRRQAVAPTAPESEPLAWDCQKYTFSIGSNGVVTLQNNSSKDEAAQQAKVYINDNLVATLDVPALPKGQSATLGTVQVPSGGFSWRVEGTKDCRSSGTSGPVSCELLTFTLTQESPTLTPTGTAATPTVTPTAAPTATLTPSSTLTPTLPPIGGPSETPSPSITTTPTPTSVTQVSPTPTTSLIAQASPTPGGEQLPAAGIGTPTIIALFGGLLILILSFILAI